MTLPPAMVLVKPKFFFGIPSGLTRIFERVKNTKMVHFVLMSDVCHPLVEMRGKSYTSDATAVSGVLFLVKCIQKFWDISKVFPSVVRSVAVDVVNLTFGFAASHEDKRKPMGFALPAANRNDRVSLRVNGPRNSALVFSVPDAASDFRSHMALPVFKHVWGGGLVSKCASLWAVGNPFRCINAFHDELLCLCINKYTSSSDKIKELTS